MRYLNKTLAAIATLAVSAVLLGACAPASSNGFKAQSSVSAAPSWAAKSVIYEVNVRDYSAEGKLTAVTADIPRLKKLGIDILWLMPIYPIGAINRKGTMGSPYSVQDYKGINPDLGNAADLHSLIDTAHAAGMHVVLDWVANHSAFDNSWALNHKDWYNQDAQGNPTWPAGTDWTDVADLNYNNQDMRAAMLDAMKYWVTTFGIDGYRCDAAWGVDTAFWETAATQLRAIKPIWMVAETQDQADLLANAFQADYGWHFKDMLYGFGSGTGQKTDFSMTMNSQAAAYPAGTYPMLFITNHDENSWTGSLSTQFGKGAKTLSVLTFTVPGMPLIYDGQEVDSNRRLAFFEKDLIDWNFASARSKTAVAFYTKLISLRHKNPSLWAGLGGGTMTRYKNDATRIVSFSRQKGANKVYIALNISPLAATANVQWGKDAKSYYRYSDGKLVKMPATQLVSLKPWGFEIYSTVKP